MSARHSQAFSWPDLYTAALALLVLAQVTLLWPALIPADLNLAYPFLDGDSHDWIANGLYLAGHDVRYSGRAPLLPLVIALLDRCEALSWLPVLLQALFLATVLTFHALASRLYPRGAAFAAATALLLNASLVSLSLQVMADVPASCLLFLGFCSFVRAMDGDGAARRRYLAAGALTGLSILTQPAALVALPVAGAVILARRREDLRSLWLWAGLALAAGPQLLWAALGPDAFGVSGGVAREQWLLLSPHLGGVPFYLFAAASLLGVPGALLLVAGLTAAVRRACRAPGDTARLAALSLFAALAVFFVFLYDYNAKRFLVYGVWLAGLFLAEALSRLRRPIAFAVAAVLLIAGSAMPQPVSGSDPTWAGLWPAPPLYLNAPVTGTATGSANLDLGETQIVRLPAATWLRFRPVPQAQEVAPASTEIGGTDVSVLYLYETSADGGGRYHTVTRLGNALRKRVSFIPAKSLEPFWPLIEVSPVTPLTADYALYRVRLPRRSETWLVAAPGGSGVQRRLDGLVGRRPQKAAEPRRLKRGLDKAQAIRHFVAGSDGFAALVPHPGAADYSQLYLPFLLRNTELFVAERGREKEMLDLFKETPVLAARSFGATRVWTTEYMGRRTAVIWYRASNPR